MKKEVLLIELSQFEVLPKPQHTRATCFDSRARCSGMLWKMPKHAKAHQRTTHCCRTCCSAL